MPPFLSSRLVEARGKSRTIPAYGLFPGAYVTRGTDYEIGLQDRKLTFLHHFYNLIHANNYFFPLFFLYLLNSYLNNLQSYAKSFAEKLVKREI